MSSRQSAVRAALGLRAQCFVPHEEAEARRMGRQLSEGQHDLERIRGVHGYPPCDQIEGEADDACEEREHQHADSSACALLCGQRLYNEKRDDENVQDVDHDAPFERLGWVKELVTIYDSIKNEKSQPRKEAELPRGRPQSI